MTHKIYIAITSMLFLGIAFVFMFLPRPTFSKVENRELADVPTFSFDKLWSGKYFEEVGHWYSDSQPFRDELMTASLNAKNLIALHLEDAEAITIHAEAEETADPEIVEEAPNGDIQEFHNTKEGVAKMGKSGTIVVGQVPNARAMSIYGGVGGGDAFAKAANKFKETFPDVNIYVMVIPSATDYYLPEKARSMSKPMVTTIKSVHSKLAPGVKPVDVYTTLGNHSDEDIYLRTDHHWAPLGAYYAARRFCEVAGVKVPDLKDYNKEVVHNFVGTMYGYSKDINVKNSPEDFVYYTPKNVEYNTTYINYSLDKEFNITRESAPVKGEYFIKHKDGSSGAYSTFMGGDSKITKVKTNAPSKRRVLVLKDSFGNAVPGYLFESFEEVHVIDFRYFNKNLKKYVNDNGITDILFANNVFMVYGGKAPSNYLRYLTQ